MARLIYASNMSLDGCTEDGHGAVDCAPPDDDVFAFITALMRSAGTYLYGRRMYESMAVWETDCDLSAQSDLTADFTNAWQAADKVVYSSTLIATPTENTRLERHFDPKAVHDLKAAAETDLLVGGPNLAVQALVAGWSTSSNCSSGQSSSVGATPRCRLTRVPGSSFSTNTDSATVSCTSATASVSRREIVAFQTG